MGGVLAATLMLAGAAYSDSVPAASATTALAHPLSELVTLADQVVVATPVKKESRWENLGGKRIVTYTTLKVERAVFGGGPSSVTVRTLGGSVGKIGQRVAGQAQLNIGETALLFLTRTSGNTLVVSGAAQGHFPLRSQHDDDGKQRRLLALSPSRGNVVRRPGPTRSAADILVGMELNAAAERILSEKRSQDAHDKR